MSRWIDCTAAVVVSWPGCLALTVGSALAQAKKSDSVVKATATADKPDAQGKQTVTITLEIKKP